MPNIRPPAVAGSFYPDNPDTLASMIESYLEQAEPTDKVPKAMIVPHAGYIYSGLAAASAFSCLIPFKKRITRVVLLGPSHRVAFNGVATSSADYFQTPLGNIRIDQSSYQKINSLPQVQQINEAHQFEHSLEVQLPFLQAVLDNFTIVPLVIGDSDSKNVSEVLEALWGGEETLLVISSDLSHFLDYDTANSRDKLTCIAIEQLLPESINDEDACGRNPIKGLLVSAKKHKLNTTTLSLYNSGDSAGDKNRVVGYGSWLFTA